MFFGNGDLLATHGGEDVGRFTKLAIQSAYDARWIEDVLINKMLRKVVVSPDSRVAGVLHFTQMNQFDIWDLERHEMRATLGSGKEMKGIFHDLAFSPDSKLIATASDDMTVRLWHVANGRDRATFPSISFDVKRFMQAVLMEELCPSSRRFHLRSGHCAISRSRIRRPR